MTNNTKPAKVDKIPKVKTKPVTRKNKFLVINGREIY